MNWREIFEIAQWVFLLYFIGLNSGYLLLNLVAFVNLKHYMAGHSLDDLPHGYIGFELPITLLAPAYNEAATIAASVRSLLQLDYPEYEIVVINDGSKDGTLEVLHREFALTPFPEAYWRRLPVQPIRGIYRSTTHPNLRVIDKENGGKADALNAGINAARYPIFCAIDADSILQRDSLRRAVMPFLEDPDTVAAGGTVRIANGCEVRGGFLHSIGLPHSPLELMQIVEYLRAFLFGRLGWSPMNGMLIISGTFGLFRKDMVVAVGGYRTDTVGEDMELVVRLHRHHRQRGERYRITFVPDPICWTEAPGTLRVLKNQRVRWQRGLAESLSLNMGLLFHRRGGTCGWLAFPFMMVFEWFGPVVEVAGYVAMTAGFLFGMVSTDALIAFIAVALGFGLMLSASALLLEEMSFHLYPKPRQLATLMVAAVAENFGYRQLNSLWRLVGLVHWALQTQPRWGEMTRSGAWQRQR